MVEGIIRLRPLQPRPERVQNVIMAWAFVLAICGRANAAPAAGKFIPPEEHTLLLIGQDQSAIREYVTVAQRVPAGFMLYTSLQRLEGLETPADSGSGIQDATFLISTYSDTVLQVGVWMVGALEATARGGQDEQITRLASWVKATGRPVFLRLGYEFDLPGNQYEPAAYIAAFQHIVDRFRSLHVENAAFVWHSYANKTSRPVLDWYPGNAYMDWIGVSYFSAIQAPYLEAVAQVAAEHGKPLMVAEATPAGIGTWPGDAAWTEWFEPFFAFVNRYHVAAISYINWDWESFPMFHGQGWGDCRVQVQEDVKRRWFAEVGSARYLHASEELYGQLGYVHPNSQ